MDEPTSKQIGTINCLLCGGTQIYPGPKYQNHLIQEHGVVFDVESLIKISIHKRDHNELFPTTKTVAIGTDDCNLKLEIKKETLEIKKETLEVKKEIPEIKKETLEEIEVQRGIAIMDKIEVKNKMAKERGLELLEKVDARIKNEIQSFNVNIKDDEDLEIRMMIDFLDVCFKNEIQNFKYDVLVETGYQKEIREMAFQRVLETSEKLDPLPPTEKDLKLQLPKIMSRHREWDIACKVYIGNLGNNGSKYEIEDVFGEYGPLKNVWVARNPPGFAFVEFENSRDAEDSVRGLDGTRVCGQKVQVEMSSGRQKIVEGSGSGRGERRSRSRSRERRRARRSPSYRSMPRSRSRSTLEVSPP